MWGWTQFLYVVEKAAASSPRMWGVPAHVSDGKGSAVSAAPPFFFVVLCWFLCVLCRSGLPLAPLTLTVHRSRATGCVLPVRGSAVFWW